MFDTKDQNNIGKLSDYYNEFYEKSNSNED